MKVIPPITITPSSGFTRSTVGSYFDRAGVMQSAAINTPRYTHDPITHDALGFMYENAATNLVLNSATLATQDVTVTAQPYTLSFYGAGSVTLSGAATAVLVGTGAFPNQVKVTFTPTAGTLTLTVTGSVTQAQLEAGSAATSYIDTTGTPASRGADVVTGTFLTNVPEPTTTLTTTTAANDPLAWNSLTAYPIGAAVYLASTHRKYIARTANTGKDPSLATIDTPSTDWVDAGPTNAYAGLDYLRNTQVVYPEEVVYVLRPGVRANAIGLANLVGNKVKIRVYRGTTYELVFSLDQSLVFRSTLTWTEYVYGKFNIQRALARFDMTAYTDAIIVVVVDYPGLEAKMGAAVIGTSVYLGATQYEAEDDVLNFSRIDRTVFGDALLTPRRNVPKTTQTTWVDKVRVKGIRAAREDLNAVPAFWSGLDDDTNDYYESLVIIGIYRRFTINLKFFDKAVVTLELEEV